MGSFLCNCSCFAAFHVVALCCQQCRVIGPFLGAPRHGVAGRRCFLLFCCRSTSTDTFSSPTVFISCVSSCLNTTVCQCVQHGFRPCRARLNSLAERGCQLTCLMCPFCSPCCSACFLLMVT